MKADKPLIIQSDFKILLEVRAENFREVRDAISPFLEIVKSPNTLYVYSINEVSLWNAFSLGMNETNIINILVKYAKFPVPEVVISFIQENYKNYGLFSLENYNDKYHQILTENEDMYEILLSLKELKRYMVVNKEKTEFLIPITMRGTFKTDMIKRNLPVKENISCSDGDPIDIEWNKKFPLREYQEKACASFLAKSSLTPSGVGVLVLPCGAGKTIVGLNILSQLKMKTLIIAPNIVSLRQWKRELLEKTNFSADKIAEYSGESKEIKDITISNYQILAYRDNDGSDFHHFNIFNSQNWGLIIYDEVHMLPAPIFQIISSIQTTRRLGLTATLVREDGKEKEVFSLIGSKKFDLPWKDLEKLNFIAKAHCFEVKTELAKEVKDEYFAQGDKEKFRIASENPNKIKVVKDLLNVFTNNKILIIGQYLTQLEKVSKDIDAPLITGKTDNSEREKLYEQFNTNKINILVVSKVANFAIDLPNADVAIQISGMYGSRQEETQRLGRIIRPKKGNNESYFFTVTSDKTKEEGFVKNRKQFLIEQGYVYKEITAEDVKKKNFITDL